MNTTTPDTATLLPYPSRMVDWTPAHRRQAAQRGWAWRRMAITPEIVAHRRLDALIRVADPRLARLYVCDQAAAVLHLVTAAYPGNTVPMNALVVARRYADGLATDKERLAAQHTLRPLLEQCDGKHPRRYAAAECALGAVWFALCKETPRVVEWSAYWASIAVHGKDDRYAFHRELIAALEAL